MQKYYLEYNSKGSKYLKNPERNTDGRIKTTYFEKTIILYILKEGKYKPLEFKEFISILDILNDKDNELMSTRKYKQWKHFVDAAKQKLQDDKVITKNPDNTFSIFSLKINDEFKKYSAFFDIKIFRSGRSDAT